MVLLTPENASDARFNAAERNRAAEPSAASAPRRKPTSVAEASARLRKTKARGSASRMEDPDAASAAFREYLARLPEAVAEAAKEKNLPRLSR